MFEGLIQRLTCWDSQKTKTQHPLNTTALGVRT